MLPCVIEFLPANCQLGYQDDTCVILMLRERNKGPAIFLFLLRVGVSKGEACS